MFTKKFVKNVKAVMELSLIHISGQNTEDLLREIELLSGKIFNGITEIRILLEQIEDAQLFHAIITLTEEQKKVILLRIFYEKTFREIGRILELSLIHI